MNIPSSFRIILEKNQKLNGIVNFTVSQYDLILSENKLYFFEEYTDHGIKHIESVLGSTLKIMPEETLDKFLENKPDSIALYILATILHDIGMHITPEGFYSLVSGNNDEVRIHELDSKTWNELWNDYLDEARRFGNNEKINIIGNVNWNFRAPDIENKDKLTGEDKKLIGEFIRRNHPRMAHEIALRGFPIDDNYIPFASDLDYDLRNICGLIARSHGVQIRNLFEYLEFKFQDTWIKPYNIEAIYLMVLLRIADYFQIDSSRTPDITVKLKTFKSPISQTEHNKHLDVKYVQPFIKDPETIIFQCEPRNSYIFIKLKDLFLDIQKELDVSWAVLGEVYGKEAKEKQPKISYRRVKSNIDNVFEFSKNITYIPEKINFNVSSELPKLLIGPLYGNDPTFGVRELLQNAVDSCREREFLEKSGYNGEVIITLFSDNNKYFFRIEDNGLGMSLNIVKNYFLEVGSSLRKSSLWKKTFSSEDGKSKIQRSGKFGIGVLAAFLIGDKISLETKDSNSSYGLSFSTNLDTNQIEIIKTEKEKVGTIITIEVEKNLLTRLKESEYSFDSWYLQDNPKVIYIDNTNTFDKLGSIIKSPGFNDKLAPEWHTLGFEGYNKIIWTYNEDFWDSKNSSLICNGILIPKGYSQDDHYNRKTQRWVRDIKLPFTSIFDFNGILPLNLNRNELDGELPFKKELQTEIYKDLIAKLLTTVIDFPLCDEVMLKQYFSHPAIGNIPIIFSKDGFILKNNFFIRKNSDKTLLEFSPKTDLKELIKFDIKDSFIYALDNNNFSMTDFQYQGNMYNYQNGVKMFLDKTMYNKLFDDNYNRYPLTVRKNHKLINSNENNVEITYNYSKGKFTLDELNENTLVCNYIAESKLKEINGENYLSSSEILNNLQELLFQENEVIPYNIEQRREKFALAFTELDYYVKKYSTND